MQGTFLTRAEGDIIKEVQQSAEADCGGRPAVSIVDSFRWRDVVNYLQPYRCALTVN